MIQGVRDTELLTEETVIHHLVSRGLLDLGVPTSVRPLDGGVSSVVLLVDDRWVVKQALPRLRVEGEWLAARERTLTEARALSYACELTPDLVPRVVDVDPLTLSLVIEAAPAHWRCWREDLFEGVADVAIGMRLGRALGRWHQQAAMPTGRARSFADEDAFEQLRVTPYFRVLAEARPEVATDVFATVEAMLRRSLTLVHGDFSPKNVLAGRDGLWVIDFEVAHLGDPTFDVAFLLTHLLLKSIHVGSGVFLPVAEGFLRSYEEQVSGPLAVDSDHLSRLTGSLLLARVDGRSPAGYLTAPARTRVRELGLDLLRSPAVDPRAMWNRLR